MRAKSLTIASLQRKLNDSLIVTLNEGMPAIRETVKVVMRRGSLPRITKASVTLFSHCCDVGGRISDLRLLENAFGRKKLEEKVR